MLNYWPNWKKRSPNKGSSFLFAKFTTNIMKEVINMLSNLREQIDALTKKNTELIATGVFSLGGIIAITLFSLFLNLVDNRRNDHKTEEES